jgi:hypothetical protein
MSQDIGRLRLFDGLICEKNFQIKASALEL